MIEIRRSGERGSADHGWLKTLHSFSFADYYDPRHMGFGALRVINEDRVAPGTGFGTHGHRDMEIITYVLEGALAHRDSLGNGSVIRPGDVQRMSAGTGVQHSEYNHEKQGVTHFLQIWIEPAQRGIAPGYEQRHFDEARRRGRLQPIAAPDAREGALTIHQDAIVYAGLFDGGERVQAPIAGARRVYVHVVRGRLRVNGETLEAGDAAKLSGESRLVLDEGEDAEALVFDLA
ncbi:MAG: pirin family protein [Burkholderiaceae bacterium]|nr:pirin family protein [Burkholderiaceae bacterium]MCD6672451.1 pirin family protein [Burkholderiaceae bacterium]